MNLITREEAKIINQVQYFTGLVCQNNHINKRYTKTGICYECKRRLNRECNSRNKETLKKISKRSYNKNKKSKIRSSQKWAENNRTKSNTIKIKYKINNLEKVRLKSRQYQAEKRLDNFKRLSMNTSKGIWECLKKKKAGRRWETIVGYTLEDLKNHLES